MLLYFIWKDEEVLEIMKAHKNIILWTFWLSVILLISTFFLYVYQPNNPENVFFKWLDVIATGILTGLIVSCIVEIGNYLSTRNKLYEKLFSECTSFYLYINTQMKAIEQYLDLIDNNADFTLIKNQFFNVISINDNQFQRYMNSTKYGDFSFVMYSDKYIRGKKIKSINGCIDCMSKLTNVINQTLDCSTFVQQGNINSSYIVAFNIFQNLINIRQELNKRVREMELTHKFANTWDKSLIIINEQNEINNINYKLSIYQNSANRRFAKNQLQSTINDMTSFVAQDSDIEKKISGVGKKIDESVAKKKKELNTKKTQS